MGTYRLEEASSGRAGCQNKECKDQKLKILKGELRLGSWVDTERIQAFFWRHWGCVTPKIIANLNETVQEGSGDGEEKDYTVLDGYEDLSAENQEKVRGALEQGHVDDEDWKGDVEMNRPGKTGFRKRAPKKKADAEEKESDKDEEEKPKKRGRTETAPAPEGPAVKKTKTKKGSRTKQETEEGDSDAALTETKPAPRRGRSAKASTEDVQSKPAAKGKGKRKSAVQEDEPAEEKPRRGRSRATTSKEEAVEAVERPKRGRKKAGSK